jgi:ribosome-associated protein
LRRCNRTCPQQRVSLANHTARCFLDTIDIAHTIVNALEDKKGEDIVLLDIHEVSDFTDYFVICSGTSDRMLQALADAAVEQVRAQHEFKGRTEGEPREGWVLVDFGNVVLHLFSPDRRAYYDLEDLWAEGKVLLHVQ